MLCEHKNEVSIRVMKAITGMEKRSAGYSTVVELRGCALCELKVSYHGEYEEDRIAKEKHAAIFE